MEITAARLDVETALPLVQRFVRLIPYVIRGLEEMMWRC